MNILILFGSESDQSIYNPIRQKLEEIGHTTELDIISAHRNPNRLKEKLTTCIYDCVVAGAGLSAHLPGVVASQTLKPVIGIPVPIAFSGLDAFLSIVQMPQGVPVLCFAHNFESQILQLISDLKDIRNLPISLFVPNKLHNEPWVQSEIKRFYGFLNDYKLKIDRSDEIEKKFHLICVSQENDLDIINHFIGPKIFIFMSSPNEVKLPETALKFHNITKIKGPWVGMNNLRNAYLASLQFLNFSNQYNDVLTSAKKKIQGKRSI